MLRLFQVLLSMSQPAWSGHGKEMQYVAELTIFASEAAWNAEAQALAMHRIKGKRFFIACSNFRTTHHKKFQKVQAELHRTSPFQGPPRSHRFSGNNGITACLWVFGNQILQLKHMTTNDNQYFQFIAEGLEVEESKCPERQDDHSNLGFYCFFRRNNSTDLSTHLPVSLQCLCFD